MEPSDPATSEHRAFPRAKMQVPFVLTIHEGDDLRFMATLQSVNLSVSGVFLESTFFLPVGTRLHARFSLEEGAAPIEAECEIVRQERADARTGEGRSGLALRFLQFYGQTEVTLAKLFLEERLRVFAESYMGSQRAQSLRTEFERIVDALAAWELQKVTTSTDVWNQ